MEVRNTRQHESQLKLDCHAPLGSLGLERMCVDSQKTCLARNGGKGGPGGYEDKDEEIEDGGDLFGALEGVVGPSLLGVVSYSSIQIVEFEDEEVNMEFIL